jgi:hypothetical protein
MIKSSAKATKMHVGYAKHQNRMDPHAMPSMHAETQKSKVAVPKRKPVKG